MDRVKAHSKNRILCKKGNPELKTFTVILGALGFSLKVA
jgi:DNA-binding phage protein